MANSGYYYNKHNVVFVNNINLATNILALWPVKTSSFNQVLRNHNYIAYSS